MRFIDTGEPWTYGTVSAGTCSITLTCSETAYLIQGITLYGGTLSNAAYHVEVSGGVNIISGYLGSAGSHPFYIPMNLDVTKRATFSVGVEGAGTGAISMHGFKIVL